MPKTNTVISAFLVVEFFARLFFIGMHLEDSISTWYIHACITAANGVKGKMSF